MFFIKPRLRKAINACLHARDSSSTVTVPFISAMLGGAGLVISGVLLIPSWLLPSPVNVAAFALSVLLFILCTPTFVITSLTALLRFMADKRRRVRTDGRYQVMLAMASMHDRYRQLRASERAMEDEVDRRRRRHRERVRVAQEQHRAGGNARAAAPKFQHPVPKAEAAREKREAELRRINKRADQLLESGGMGERIALDNTLLRQLQADIRAFNARIARTHAGVCRFLGVPMPQISP